MPLHLLQTSLSFLWFQSRFADALLRELAGITIPPERIYGLGTGLVLLFYIFTNSGESVHYTNTSFHIYICFSNYLIFSLQS